MKKTTYILIGLIAALLLTVFLMPPILWKKSDIKQYVTVEYRPTVEITRSIDSAFTAVEIKSNYLLEDMSVDIIGDADSACCLTMDSLLMAHTDVTVVDSMLTIEMHSPKIDGQYINHVDSDKGYKALELHVPARYIKRLDCNRATVTGLEGDTLRIYVSYSCGKLVLNDCKFNTIIY